VKKPRSEENHEVQHRGEGEKSSTADSPGAGGKESGKGWRVFFREEGGAGV